eukprot:FR740637.1.p4 GENE.FR740637.1~~FR740637.1.p4  ORF type:complete len:113 (-),score=8.36 FR740637.1:70-408(-)
MTDVDYLRREKMYFELTSVPTATESDGFILHPVSRREPAKKGKKNTHVFEYVERMPVMSRWSVDGRLFPAPVPPVNADRTFNVKFLDGPMAIGIPWTDMRPHHRSKDARWDP